jgi:hypothetical protein
MKPFKIFLIRSNTMSVNPNAVQLLSGKYQQYATLLAQRADIDSKIMIVATDIAQITSAAFVNAPIGGIEETPPAPVAPAPVAPVKKAKAVVAEPAPKVEAPVVEAPVAELKVPTLEEANAMVQAVVASKGAAVLQSEVQIQKYTPFTGLTDELKAEFYAALVKANA